MKHELLNYRETLILNLHINIHFCWWIWITFVIDSIQFIGEIIEITISELFTSRAWPNCPFIGLAHLVINVSLALSYQRNVHTCTVNDFIHFAWKFVKRCERNQNPIIHSAFLGNYSQFVRMKSSVINWRRLWQRRVRTEEWRFNYEKPLTNFSNGISEPWTERSTKSLSIKSPFNYAYLMADEVNRNQIKGTAACQVSRNLRWKGKPRIALTLSFNVM